MFTYLKARLVEFSKDQRGVTVIEYALMLFMIAVAVAATLTPIRSRVIAIFSTALSALT
ncbi:MAG: Flp family type IVb pilin [Acidobacteria bacterium]|nr:MAG: Flp family type IVb pilin [Acidobacteriota bacterium]